MLTLDTIMKDSLWIAKMTYGYRAVGTYDKIKDYGNSEDCRDFDLCAEQPEHLKPFYNDYFQYDGFITIQDFYNNIWLPAQEEKMESLQEKKEKKVWSAEEIKNLIQTNDKVLYGALKKLYACQTEDEKVNKDAAHNNGAGFNGVDAPILTSFCEFLERAGFLTVKQKAIARKKLVKYNAQLTKLANA